MRVIAATNLQLYRQLQDAGWPAIDIRYMHEACKVAAELSRAAFTPSWTPLGVKLISLASIVAWDSKQYTMVAAALVLGLVEHGQYPFWTRTAASRIDYLGRRVGAPVAQLVEAYHRAKWTDLFSLGRALSSLDRKLMHLKLAGMLAEMMDEFGLVATDRKLPIDFDDHGEQMRLKTLALAIGASEMARAFAELGEMDRPTAVVREAATEAFLIRSVGQAGNVGGRRDRMS
jgi:hypothetical protein